MTSSINYHTRGNLGSLSGKFNQKLVYQEKLSNFVTQTCLFLYHLVYLASLPDLASVLCIACQDFLFAT